MSRAQQIYLDRIHRKLVRVKMDLERLEDMPASPVFRDELIDLYNRTDALREKISYYRARAGSL